mgnify:CR=1 FL=1
MRTILLLLANSILFSCGINAQATVTIQETAGIKEQLEKYIQTNSTITHLSGWRITIITTTDRRLMEQTKAKFQAQYDYRVKWEYKEPYYYLKAGAFLIRTEANLALEFVKKKFPQAFLSMDKVAYEEL